MVGKEWEGRTRKTLVAAMVVLAFTAIMLALPGSALALPSEVPDDTPMVDGRVRAIEQVGTNVWLGGKFTQVKKRDGTVLGSVSNVAVFNSETNRFKNLAPKLGGTDSEVWDMTIYGNDVLIAGNFPGPSITQKNLVLVKGAGPNAGQVIRWYNSPSLKSVLAAPGLGRVSESLGLRLCHGQEALDQSEDYRRPHHTYPRQQSGLSRPRARRRRPPDDLGCVHLRRGGRQPRQGTDQARHRG